eukprot:jgi/Chrzof1/13558/Cz08g02030.t1
MAHFVSQDLKPFQIAKVIAKNAGLSGYRGITVAYKKGSGYIVALNEDKLFKASVQATFVASHPPVAAVGWLAGYILRCSCHRGQCL